MGPSHRPDDRRIAWKGDIGALNGILDGRQIVVEAGRRPRWWTPVSCEVGEVDPALAAAGGRLALKDERGLIYPAQLEQAPGGARITFIVHALEAGEARRFSVVVQDQAPAGVTFSDRPEDRVNVSVNGRTFTEYVYGKEWARPYLYPVIGPAGATVTRHFPMRSDVPGEKHDHPHHKSIFFTHGDVNGVDNWSEAPGHGRTRHASFARLAGGPVFGDLWSDNIWVDAEEKPLLRQEIRLRFYALPDHLRMFDAEVVFTADHGDVVFGDTKEGGLISVRVASTMDASGAGTIETGTGAIGEAESWGRPAPWCHYSGPVQAATGPMVAGIGILDHPSNPRHPVHWHVRDYGLMTANPFGLSYFYKDKRRDGSMKLAAGETAVFRYRVLIHEGAAAAGRMADHFAAFAHPPKATLV